MLIKNLKFPKQVKIIDQAKNIFTQKNYKQLFSFNRVSYSSSLVGNHISLMNKSINNFHPIPKKFFSNNINKENSDFQEVMNNDDKNNLLNNLDLEFEKLLEKSDNTELEKRIKILSIKLLQANSSKEIMNLYDEKYLKNLIEISADEIILILYFYTSLLDKETAYNSSNNPIKGKIYHEIFYF